MGVTTPIFWDGEVTGESCGFHLSFLLRICYTPDLVGALTGIRVNSVSRWHHWFPRRYSQEGRVRVDPGFVNADAILRLYLLTGSNNSYQCLVSPEIYSMLLNARPLFRLQVVEVVGPLMYKRSLVQCSLWNKVISLTLRCTQGRIQ